MARQIIRTGIGEVEDVTAVVPSDAQSPQLALGSYTVPTAWLTPTRVENDDEAGTKLLVLRVGPANVNPVAGRYWLWFKYLNGTGELITDRMPNSVTVDTDTGNPLVPAVDVASQQQLADGLATKQAADADLTSIAALDSTVAGVLASDGAGWLRKSYATLKTALNLGKGDVGLGNVDNTADAVKPVSTAQATADTAVQTAAAADASSKASAAQSAAISAAAADATSKASTAQSAATAAAATDATSKANAAQSAAISAAASDATTKAAAARTGAVTDAATAAASTYVPVVARPNEVTRDGNGNLASQTFHLPGGVTTSVTYTRDSTTQKIATEVWTLPDGSTKTVTYLRDGAGNYAGQTVV